MQENKNIQHYKKNNTSVEYKYICIKKDVFDESMIFLNNSSLKEKKFIEIIYNLKILRFIRLLYYTKNKNFLKLN